MKKIFLIIFVIMPLDAGRPVFLDPYETINTLKIRAACIRTRWGFDLPPEEAEEHEALTFAQQIQEFKRFQALWADFQLQKKYLSKYIPFEKKADYETFVTELLRDKNRYEDAIDKELRLLKQENDASENSYADSDERDQ